MALRIAKATNTYAESWVNMQIKLTLWNAYPHEPKKCNGIFGLYFQKKEIINYNFLF